MKCAHVPGSSPSSGSGVSGANVFHAEAKPLLPVECSTITLAWGRTEQRLRLAPANTGNANEDAVVLGIPPQQLDRFLRPVSREHLAAAERRGERRQPEAATELENP